MISIYDIPYELIEYVYSYLTLPRHILSLAITCKYMHTLIIPEQCRILTVAKLLAPTIANIRLHYFKLLTTTSNASAEVIQGPKSSYWQKIDLDCNISLHIFNRRVVYYIEQWYGDNTLRYVSIYDPIYDDEKFFSGDILSFSHILIKYFKKIYKNALGDLPNVEYYIDYLQDHFLGGYPESEKVCNSEWMYYNNISA